MCRLVAEESRLEKRIDVNLSPLNAHMLLKPDDKFMCLCAFC